MVVLIKLNLKVYFDEDYLLSGQSTGESQANYWLLDEDSVDYSTEPHTKYRKNRCNSKNRRRKSTR